MQRASGPILALDPGRVRIGLALSDALRLAVRPLAPLRTAGKKADVSRIADLVRQHAVTTVIVGLPLHMSGEAGAAAATAQRLAGRLRAGLAGVDVQLWDERLTTVEAERTLIEAGMSRRVRRERIDGAAAVLILESYLAAGRSGPEPIP